MMRLLGVLFLSAVCFSASAAEAAASSEMKLSDMGSSAMGGYLESSFEGILLEKGESVVALPVDVSLFFPVLFHEFLDKGYVPSEKAGGTEYVHICVVRPVPRLTEPMFAKEDPFWMIAVDCKGEHSVSSRVYGDWRYRATELVTRTLRGQ